MKKIISILCLVLLGCGSDSSDEPTLEGKWYRDDMTYPCAYLLNLEGGMYEFFTVCELSDNQIGVEVDVGSYSDNKGELAFSPEKGSCLTGPEPYSIMYKLLDKNHLRMSGTIGAAIFERYKDPGSNDNGNIIYGCYDADVNFVANPIAPY